MPTLSIDFTDAQAHRLRGVFGDAATCETWLRERIVAHVLATEQQRMQADALEEQRGALAALRAELEEAAR